MSGSEHPDTLRARANLAYWTGEAGNAAEAREQYAALLPIIERVLGPEHPNTLDAGANLAFFTGEAGNAAEAREQYTALLPITERVLGPEHPQTLMTRVNLARWTGQAGDASAPETSTPRCCRSAASVRPGAPEHAAHSRQPWPLDREAGDAAGARDQYAALLPAIERILGADHPGTLRTRASLAHWTGKAGDAAGAQDEYAALLPAIERMIED